MKPTSLDTHLLEAGQVIILSKPAIIRTVVGSCMCVTFFDEKSKVGAMIHGMYAGEGKNFYYIETAIEHIVSQFIDKGIELSNIEVKLFGGASIPYYFGDNSNHSNVNELNIRSAKEAIKRFGLKVHAEDLRCACPREIRFYTEDGIAYLKKMVSKKTCNSDFCVNRNSCPAHETNQ